MNKKALIDQLWDERRICILNPSKFKIARQGPKIIEVYYSGKIHIDEMPSCSEKATE